jgi:hypothetical protein
MGCGLDSSAQDLAKTVIILQVIYDAGNVFSR